MKTLETTRLILRSWKESDLEDFYEYASVEGVGESAGWPHHENIESSRKILNDFIKNDDVFAIVLKAENKVIGSLGLHDESRNPEFYAGIHREIGYVLNKNYWGMGLVPEAVTEVIKYAFDELNIDVLWCSHFTVNNKSKRVIEKCGFKFYGDNKYTATPLNKVFDDKVYVITKNDYTAGL